MKEEDLFRSRAQKLSEKHKEISVGKMMSSPGILFGKKVFAFYHNKNMIFKLGKEFDITEEGVKHYTHLSPFKNKAPMKAWYVVPYSEKTSCEGLANKALQKIKELR